METKIMLRKFGKYFPKKYAKMNHDYVGLMVGKLPENVTKIMICLDCDWELLPYIKKHKPQLIISHHPFIFGTKYQVFKYDESKKDLYNEIDKMGICVYSLHTNFDCGTGGMNDALASALNLKNVFIPEKNNMMRIGELEKPMNVKDFACYAKEAFNTEYGLLVNAGNEIINKVGIIGGGGSRSWKIAKENGADIYISGDAPHYVRRDIVNFKFNYLDFPHEIEKIFIKTMEKFLLEIDQKLDIVCIDHEKIPTII